MPNSTGGMMRRLLPALLLLTALPAAANIKWNDTLRDVYVKLRGQLVGDGADLEVDPRPLHARREGGRAVARGEGGARQHRLRHVVRRQQARRAAAAQSAARGEQSARRSSR